MAASEKPIILEQILEQTMKTNRDIGSLTASVNNISGVLKEHKNEHRILHKRITENKTTLKLDSADKKTKKNSTPLRAWVRSTSGVMKEVGVILGGLIIFYHFLVSIGFKGL